MKFHSLISVGFLALSFLVTSVNAADDVATAIAKFEGSLLARGSDDGKRWHISERMAHYKVPGLSVAVIRDGKLAWAKGYGVRLAGMEKMPVDTETMFSVGSVSKVGAAATVLRLVDEGKIDLDRDINTYLTRWQVPQNKLTDKEAATMRRILSHTAGLTVHGFADYALHEELPPVEDTLLGRGAAKNDTVLVDILPGSKYRYSGGGTTVAQLVVEEVSGKIFNDAVKQYLFKPLSMKNSSYENPLPLSRINKARPHDENGALDAWEVMPEAAASGLWTTPSDYAQLVTAFIKSYRGEKGSFLSKELAHDTMTEVKPGRHGLGPRLEGSGEFRRFSHGGSNQSYKAHMEGHLHTGNGVVIFTNAAQGFYLIEEVYGAISDVEGWKLEKFRED